MYELFLSDDFDRQSREFYRLASKKATLETREEVDHADSDEYQTLLDRMAGLRADTDETLDDIFDVDPGTAFCSL